MSELSAANLLYEHPSSGTSSPNENKGKNMRRDVVHTRTDA